MNATQTAVRRDLREASITVAVKTGGTVAQAYNRLTFMMGHGGMSLHEAAAELTKNMRHRKAL